MRRLMIAFVVFVLAMIFSRAVFAADVSGSSNMPEPLPVVAVFTPDAAPVTDDRLTGALTYPEAVKLSLATGKPLIVWVGGDVCERCVRESASDFVHVFVSEFPGVTAPALVVAVREDMTTTVGSAAALSWVETVDWWIEGDKQFGHVPTVRGAIARWRERRAEAHRLRVHGASAQASAMYTAVAMPLTIASRTTVDRVATTRAVATAPSLVFGSPAPLVVASSYAPMMSTGYSVSSGGCSSGSCGSGAMRAGLFGLRRR